MSRRMIGLLILGSVLVGGLAYSSRSIGQGPAVKSPPNGADSEPARKAILGNVRAYMEAFNRRDAKAILELFADDCTITEVDGTRVRGLKELKAELDETFADEPDTRISVAVDTLTFPAPNVAIETGKVTYFPDGKTAASEAEYEVTHVQTGPKWLMSHARVFNRTVLSPYDRLRDLEWLVGDWIDEGEGSVLESSYRWDTNKAFLLQTFTLRIKGQKALTGVQRIGWDPLSKQIKAWIFDSEGGFGDSLWSSVDDGWVIKINGVRIDGTVVTATNELKQVAKDRLRLESVDRIVGEERKPNFTTFAVRKPPAAQD
jgi:uncharacterized protein (TIGR02246 family)